MREVRSSGFSSGQSALASVDMVRAYCLLQLNMVLVREYYGYARRVSGSCDRGQTSPGRQAAGLRLWSTTHQYRMNVGCVV